jgi:hypothetical protein
MVTDDERCYNSCTKGSSRGTRPRKRPRGAAAGGDVCPTSNVRLGAVPTLAEHPLPVLLAAGVGRTVNTDDPGIFDTDLGREHEAASMLGHTAEAAYAAGALCDDVTREALHRRAGTR